MAETMLPLEKQVIVEILLLYKDSPCLWDKNHPQYKNKRARDEAHEKLMDKWRPVFPQVSMLAIKNKIDNLRATFAREWKAVQLSKIQAAASGSDHTYEPSLYYYNYLTFLKENETLDITAEQLEHGHEDSIAEGIKQKIKRRRLTEKKENALFNINKYTLTELAAISSFGQTVAAELKQMTKVQKSIAEIFITRILSYGKLGELSMDFAVTLSDTKHLRKDLSDDNIETLIEEVKKREYIWNPESKHYYNQTTRDKAWRDIADTVGVEEYIAKTKWEHLREKFSKEQKVVNVQHPDYYQGSWKFFKFLWFLEEMNNPEPHKNSDEETYIVFENYSDEDLEAGSIAVEETVEVDPLENRTRKKSKEKNVQQVTVSEEVDPLQHVTKKMVQEHDFEMMFLMSLTPYFKELCTSRRLFVRNKIQEVLFEEINNK